MVIQYSRAEKIMAVSLKMMHLIHFVLSMTLSTLFSHLNKMVCRTTKIEQLKKWQAPWLIRMIIEIFLVRSGKYQFSCFKSNFNLFYLGKDFVWALLWKISKYWYCRVFGCKCIILNTKDNLKIFYSKSDDDIFLGYSSTRKACRVFN